MNMEEMYDWMCTNVKSVEAPVIIRILQPDGSRLDCEVFGIVYEDDKVIFGVDPENQPEYGQPITEGLT